jgi:exodeoxyribonuclease VII large subunit
VIQDILNILTRRYKGFHVVLNPVKVQGEGAAAEIAQAINDFNRYDLADVLIVGRGGGSIEDLWAFNEEIVAKAIYESKIPIISAVGHETDFTIADWVADVRAPTPSAAAEIAIAEKANLLKFLSQVEAATTQRLTQQVANARQKLQMARRHPIVSSPLTLLMQPMQQLDAIREDLDGAMKVKLEQKKSLVQSYAKQLALLEPSQQITLWANRLKPFGERLAKIFAEQLRQKRERLARIEQHLRSIHPKNLMKKGYSILFSEKDGSLILSAENLAPKQTIQALLHDGKVSATIDTVAHGSGNSLF